MTLRSVAVAFLALCMLGSAVVPAQAAPQPVSVVVFTPDAAGQDGAAVKKILDGMREQLAKLPSVKLLATPPDALVDVMFEFECIDLDNDCLTKIANKYGADKLVLTTVEGKGDALKVDVRLFDRAAGKDEKTYSRKGVAAARLAVELGAGLSEFFGAPPAAVAAPVTPPKPPEPAVVAPPPPKNGTVRVSANVEAAGVGVDGAQRATTPAVLELAPGKHTIRVSKANHRDVTREVVVEAGKQVEVAVILEPLAPVVAATPATPATPPATPATPPVTPPPGGAKPFYKTWWFWTAIGGGLALASVATGLGIHYAGGSSSSPRGALSMTINSSLAECDVTLGGGTCSGQQ